MPSPTSTSPSKPPPKNIPNPRRLLILTPPSQSPSIIPPLLHTLSGVPVTDIPQTQPDPDTSSSQEKDSGTQSQSQLEPDSATPSFAGYTTHSPLQLSTKYYKAEVPIWVDEVPLDLSGSSDSGSATWKADFLSEEADIVREAVGALVVAVKAPATHSVREGETDIAQSEDVLALSALMRDIGAVKGCIDEERGGMDVPGVFLLVKSGSGSGSESASATVAASRSSGEEGEELGDDVDVPLSVGWWEDRLFDLGLFGWEVVEWDPLGNEEAKTKNKFGEYEGMPRVKEVLETHDWSAATADDGLEDDLEEALLGFDGERGSGFGMEVNELEREMLGLRMAIEQGGGDGESNGEEDEEEENKVESMETLIMRMQSLRDMGSELPDSERRKFAAKAVQDIMREL
ncbi:uncharacterized protein N7469_010390 [Penicillium citrinum]|uniref:Alpha and gamma adaptin binding protein p34 n=1 Tax=Penicillium citrinum TaxID=5077 RepID=A0A9W9NKN6_PENCI|nr:uncharacterized protein N7469_010390 [Penicillium citrinum]KAJ5221503.1 hypothetical protein N7469_010390 [Penicillium citrinum]KAK5797952.1 hypothetical protein VI817_004243 [Penicillium citrinum]